MFFNGFRQGVHLNFGLSGFISLCVFASAALLLMMPSSNFRLLILAFFGVTDFALRLPQMANHFFILGIGNTLILIALLINYRKKKNREEWFANLAPFLRLSFLIIYGSAAIAKLNSGFLATENSCAFYLANREFEWLGINIDFRKFDFFPHLISLTELIIFLGLIFFRTRFLAVVLASIFHISLSLTPVSQGLGFTFVLFGFLNLFISPEIKLNLISKIRTKQIEFDKKVPLDIFKLIYAFLAISLAIGYLVTSRSLVADRAIRWLFSLSILSLIGLCLIILSLSARRVRIKKPVFKVKGIIQILVAAFVVTTAISPYIGLKTRPTFTMYSNLSVEGNQTNHYFIPRILKNSFADDLVTINKSSDSELQQDADNGIKWVYLELQRKLQKSPNTQISYTRNGVSYNFNQASENPDLINPNPVLLKMLSFRKVYPNDFCVW